MQVRTAIPASVIERSMHCHGIIHDHAERSNGVRKVRSRPHLFPQLLGEQSHELGQKSVPAARRIVKQPISDIAKCPRGWDHTEAPVQLCVSDELLGIHLLATSQLLGNDEG
jgi:hypothetical protein